MEGQLIPLDSLPSKGIAYPDDIEIYVKPLTIKEQMDMDKYGVSQAEYYRIILNGITIVGSFNKNDLLFYDVHFMDLVRRLFTFDVEEEIGIKGIKCKNIYCEKEVPVKFRTSELECTDFSKDIFDKEFTFSDGLTVVVSPLTISDFLTMSRKYINKKEGISNVVMAYYSYCVKSVKERTFKTDEMMHEFLVDYFSNLYKNKDIKTLRQIEDETVCALKPVKVYCPFCNEEMEVEVTPTLTFQQD